MRRSFVSNDLREAARQSLTPLVSGLCVLLDRMSRKKSLNLLEKTARETLPTCYTVERMGRIQPRRRLKDDSPTERSKRQP